MTAIFRSPTSIPLFLSTLGITLVVATALHQPIQIDAQLITILAFETAFIALLLLIARCEVWFNKNTVLTWPLFITGSILFIMKTTDPWSFVGAITLMACSHVTIWCASLFFNEEEEIEEDMFVPTIKQNWAMLPIIAYVLYDSTFLIFLATAFGLMTLHMAAYTIRYRIVGFEKDGKKYDYNWRNAGDAARLMFLPQPALALAYIITVVGFQ